MKLLRCKLFGHKWLWYGGVDEDTGVYEGDFVCDRCERTPAEVGKATEVVRASLEPDWWRK